MPSVFNFPSKFTDKPCVEFSVRSNHFHSINSKENNNIKCIKKLSKNFQVVMKFSLRARRPNTNIL